MDPAPAEAWPWMHQLCLSMSCSSTYRPVAQVVQLGGFACVSDRVCVTVCVPCVCVCVCVYVTVCNRDRVGGGWAGGGGGGKPDWMGAPGAA